MHPLLITKFVFALVVSFVWQYPDVAFDVSRPLVATLGWKAATLLEPSKEYVHATAKLYDGRSLDGFNISSITCSNYAFSHPVTEFLLSSDPSPLGLPFVYDLHDQSMPYEIFTRLLELKICFRTPQDLEDAVKSIKTEMLLSRWARLSRMLRRHPFILSLLGFVSFCTVLSWYSKHLSCPRKPSSLLHPSTKPTQLTFALPPSDVIAQFADNISPVLSGFISLDDSLESEISRFSTSDGSLPSFEEIEESLERIHTAALKLPLPESLLGPSRKNSVMIQTDLSVPVWDNLHQLLNTKRKEVGRLIRELHAVTLQRDDLLRRDVKHTSTQTDMSSSDLEEMRQLIATTHERLNVVSAQLDATTHQKDELVRTVEELVVQQRMEDQCHRSEIMLKEREIDSERSETRAATSAVNERAAELTKLEVRLAEEAKNVASAKSEGTKKLKDIKKREKDHDGREKELKETEQKLNDLLASFEKAFLPESGSEVAKAPLKYQERIERLKSGIQDRVNSLDVKDKEIRSLEKALADAMKMLSPKDTVKPSSSIPRLKSPRDTPQSNTTRPSPTSRSPPPPFSSVVDVSYEDENTFPSKFGDDPRVKTRGKRGSIQKLSLSQRQSEGYGVSRQPNGPPSGFDELGNRNFAKRNKERKSELLLKGLLRDCQNMEKKEMIVSMSPPRAQRGWSPTLPSPSPLPRIPPVPPYTKTSEPPEAWAAKHPFALGIWQQPPRNGPKLSAMSLEKLEMNVSSLDDELLAVSPDAFFSDTDPDFLNSDENAQIIYTSTPPPATWPHRRQVDPAQHNALDKSTFESQQNINLK